MDDDPRGIILVLTCALGWRYRSKTSDSPALFSGLLLGLGLGMMITLGRSQLGIGSTMASRYMYFQAILPIFLYLLYIKHSDVSRSSLNWLMGILLVVTIVRWQNQIGDYSAMQNKMSQGLYAYQVTGDPEYLPVKFVGRSEKSLELAKHIDLYDAMQVDVTPQPIKKLRKRSELIPMQFKRQKEMDEEVYYLLSGWAFPAFQPTKNLSIYFELQGESQTYYLPTGPLYHLNLLCKLQTLVL